MNRIHRCIAIICLLFIQISSYAQPTKSLTSGEIFHKIQKLNFLGSVLFVAAHPDDENTRLISYLVNDRKANTTYLSLTRGDGGQNLIGPQISEYLGVIRTQELLAARRTDGGQQMFSRANDFGYSKNAEETIAIWDDDLVKQDVVWAIRKLQPDVIINRFDHRTSGTTHGHHTASAILTYDLFEKASDPKVYQDQLQYYNTWKASRLFFNQSWFFYGSQEKFDAADKSQLVTFDVGTYFPALGKSNTEIAAESRSNHKCQGFGSTGTRGSQMEYLELLKGTMPADKSDIFNGINTTWTRVKGGEKIKVILDKVQNQYNFLEPQKSIPDLLQAFALITNLKDNHWKNIKSKEISEIIEACLGLYVEGIVASNTLVPEEITNVKFEVISRLGSNVTLQKISLTPEGRDTIIEKKLDTNKGFTWQCSYKIPASSAFTSPYWLKETGSKGMYKVDDQSLIGLPETPRELKVRFDFIIGGLSYSITKDLKYKFNSQKDGEVYRPLEIVPAVSLNFSEGVYIFNSAIPKKVTLTITSQTADQKGEVSIPLPEGWRCDPASQTFSLKEKGRSADVEFTITPGSMDEEISVIPVATVDGKEYSSKLTTIDYEHIPLQLVFQPAESKFVRLNLKKSGNTIGYIKGAGDEVDKAIRQMGYNVVSIDVHDMSLGNIAGLDAIVLGIRAFNTVDELKFKKDVLFEYVKNGGNVIVQYNVNRPLITEKFAPYDVKISRDRTTVEEAEVRFIHADHEVLNFPNKITSKDFEGWVQERGLYFAETWDPAFTPILSCNDPGETAKDGGLLIAKYGDGNFIYTGYSWFRQLPAGVAGAYRIFANMISLGKTNKP